jgi:hypothetical protein
MLLFLLSVFIEADKKEMKNKNNKENKASISV